MTAYETTYPGANYLLDPNYGFAGYRISAGDIGASTGIQTANQLQDVTNFLNQGMKTVELSTIDPTMFEMIPKQHLKEIERLNKLTGTNVTIHSPQLDPAGVTERGWDEQNQKAVERQFENIVERSHELDPNGNIPVTIHASMMPGSQLIPEKEAEKMQILLPEEKGKKEVLGMMVAINQQTGELTGLKREKMYSPDKPEGEVWNPQKRLKSINNTQWTNEITNLAFYKKEADEIIRTASPELQPLLDRIERGEELSEEELNRYKPYLAQLEKGKLFLENVQASFRNLFEEAAKYPARDEKSRQVTKEILNDISKEWKKFAEQAKQKKMSEPEYILKQSRLLDDSLNKLRILGEGVEAPQKFIPFEEFTKEKASETLSNVAVNSYKKFGDKSPIISIENPPYGGALATGSELKELIEKTRKKFIDKLTKEGKSKSEAEKAAEKLIGATWDTSHISMIRKQGFGKEKLIEETKKIAPYVKHVHLNDNFGHTHSDLPPGMGTVPMKELLAELEKNAPKAKKVFEGGQWFAQFKVPPHSYILEGLGSPVFSEGVSPYWNQLGVPGAYYTGHGPVNPQIHHSVYGAGFTTLPSELGGEMPGERSRFSGTPNV